ncbi:uncharacterized protein LOC116035611 isoform X2 [Sander lucioperca]|uniref:uncharacterized protein LOC116035611 isoform X2 n=1 Tax=Sander lucioperca TaxID=283035 RepID=UPI001653B625|nr:uncharacterized protein LOC116035611 isoform X2 [Sander lucioperca]
MVSEKISCCKGEEIIHGPPDVEICGAVGCFKQDLSCALSETTQDMLTDLPQSLLPKDYVASGPGVSAGTAQQDIALFTPMCSSIFPTQLQIFGIPQTPSPTCNITATSAPSDITNESSPKAQLKTDEPCVRSLQNGQLVETGWKPVSLPLAFYLLQSQEQLTHQGDKEEPAGRSSLGKDSQGAIRSVRTILRKGKRVKRA